MRSFAVIFLLSLTFLSIQAEDWTTKDGKTYKGITVVKIEDDAVTILDADGGALVPLAVLTPDLQKRFHYDPAKATVAQAKRQQDEQASQQAIADQKKAELAQTQPVTPPPVPAAPTVASTPATTSPSASSFAAAAVPTTPVTASTTPPPAAPSSQFAVNPGTPSTGDSTHATVNPNWKLVWSDEFDGDSIDTSKWNFEVNGDGGGNNELQYYTDRPENAKVENGHLLITAIKEDYRGPDGKSRHYTSARMTTKGKFFWKYGRFEARIKMPKGKGTWPAFWLMPEDNVYGGWARSGELDIVEVIGQTPNIAYGTIHYGDSWPHNTHTGDKFTLPSGDLSDDWHVYAVEWEEGQIRWYIDGQLYQTQTKWYTNGGNFPAPFDQNFFIIFNFAVGGAWPGPPNSSTTFPQTMDVDYVRVYQPAP
jgi:beta-glucanase (GH16 family)